MTNAKTLVPRSPSIATTNLCVARYIIDGPVLPLVQDTLPLAEQTRRHLMGIYRRIEEDRLHKAGLDITRVRSETFSGKDESGEPLSGHRHAFYLPTDEDGDGRIDHITVYLRPQTDQHGNVSGFDRTELQTLDRLRRLRFGDTEPLRLLLVGLSNDHDVASTLFAESRTWQSATPFVATRYPKKRGRRKDPPELLGRGNEEAFIMEVLREQLARLRELRPDLPEPDIRPLPDRRIGRLRPIQFKRFRQKRGDDGGRRMAGAFTLTFAEPVRGPFCLGHSAHFGLGLFLPSTAQLRR